MSQNCNTLLLDLPSDEYHGTPDTWSSSNLKTANEDMETFIKKYVTKEIPREHINAFDIGTYFHTSILEPHKLDEECAVWGNQRRGKEWEEFQEKNKHKAIIILS